MSMIHGRNLASVPQNIHKQTSFSENHLYQPQIYLFTSRWVTEDLQFLFEFKHKFNLYIASADIHKF